MRRVIIFASVPRPLRGLVHHALRLLHVAGFHGRHVFGVLGGRYGLRDTEVDRRKLPRCPNRRVEDDNCAVCGNDTVSVVKIGYNDPRIPIACIRSASLCGFRETFFAHGAFHVCRLRCTFAVNERLFQHRTERNRVPPYRRVCDSGFDACKSDQLIRRLWKQEVVDGESVEKVEP